MCFSLGLVVVVFVVEKIVWILLLDVSVCVMLVIGVLLGVDVYE